MNTSDLPEQLKRAMIEAGLVDPRRDTPSMSAWGREANVHTSTISNFIQGGKAHPSSVRKMADTLGVSVSSLNSMTGHGEQEPWTPPSGTERLTVRQRAALNELIASFTDPTQGESHDRQGEEEPGTEARSQKHSSEDRSKNGSEARRTGAAMKHFYGLAADTDEAAGREASEGVRQQEHADTLGEESQDHGDHH